MVSGFTAVYTNVRQLNRNLFHKLYDLKFLGVGYGIYGTLSELNPKLDLFDEFK